MASSLPALRIPRPKPELPRYPLHEPTTALTFPHDEGWHSVVPRLGLANPYLGRMEWAYTNAHLVDASGDHLVIFVAYFTQGLRLLTVRRFDPQWRLLDEHTGSTFGLLRPAVGHFDLSFRHPHGRDRWSALLDDAGEPVPFGSRLQLEHEGVRIDLELRPRKAPYHAGDSGFLPFAQRGWFYYYSLTRLDVTGSVRLGRFDAECHDVRGHAWLDHQWGEFYVTPFRNPRLFEQYEWFSVQLSNGADIVLTTVWDRDGQLPSRDAFGGAGLVRPDGSTGRLVGTHRFARTHFYRDPHGEAIYSAGWLFAAPEWDCDLTIRPRHPDQITPIWGRTRGRSKLGALRHLAPWVDALGAFWEGSCEVTGTFGGKHVTGDAFAELLKRYSRPEVHIESPVVRAGQGARRTVVLRWRVTNWDPAVDLHYRVRVVRPDGSLLAGSDDLGISVFCFDHTPAQQHGRAPAYDIIVEACSADHVLRGEARGRWRLDRLDRMSGDGTRP